MNIDNINKLKGAIRSLGMTQGEVAEKMGVSLSRFNTKLNSRADAQFDLSELRALKELLGLNADQMDEIFFR